MRLVNTIGAERVGLRVDNLANVFVKSIMGTAGSPSDGLLLPQLVPLNRYTLMQGTCHSAMSSILKFTDLNLGFRQTPARR
jgi:hypothetical protein